MLRTAGRFTCRLYDDCKRGSQNYFQKPHCHPDTEQHVIIQGHVCGAASTPGPPLRPWKWPGLSGAHAQASLAGVQYHEAPLGNHTVLRASPSRTLQCNPEPQPVPGSTAILPKWMLTGEYKIRKVIINQITNEVTPTAHILKIRFCSHHTCPKKVRV